MPNNHTNPTLTLKSPESTTWQKNASPNLHLNNISATFEEPTIGKPKACEMSDPVTGKVLQTFRSCSEAERITKISRATIGKGKNLSFIFIMKHILVLISSISCNVLATQKLKQSFPTACREGGGLVDDKLFRYVYDRKNRDLEKINYVIENIVTNPLKTKQNNCDENEFDGRNSKKKQTFSSNSSEASVGQLPYEREPKTFNEINNESDKANDDIPPVKYLDFTQKSIKNHSLKPTNFDITKLHPVHARIVPGNRKRFIELICRGTGKSLLCFRGYGVAAKALQIDKATVKKMCETQGSDNESFFPSFILR